MDQHPVPQNISSYEFRLVGDMTLKQFFQLAGGIALGLIFFRSPFPFFIKYPLVFISVLGGILLAFVPFQGRPFSQWIMAFFKAVYSPTEFFWNPLPVAPVIIAPIETPSDKAPANALDKLETQLVSRFTDLFNTVTHKPAVPVVGTEPTYLNSISNLTPTPSSNQSDYPTVSTLREQIASATPPPPTPIVMPEPVYPTKHTVAQTPIPEVNPFRSTSGLTPTARYSPLVGSEVAATTMSVFTPTQANILAGMVVNSLGQVLEGAILEIAEKATGLPVRALRSNKLGQFQIATPLANGEYVITTDKEGYLFDPLVIITSGEIIQPIEIKAKAVS